MDRWFTALLQSHEHLQLSNKEDQGDKDKGARSPQLSSVFASNTYCNGRVKPQRQLVLGLWEHSSPGPP